MSDPSWNLKLQPRADHGQWISLMLNIFLCPIPENSGTILLCEEHRKGSLLSGGAGICTQDSSRNDVLQTLYQDSGEDAMSQGTSAVGK